MQAGLLFPIASGTDLKNFYLGIHGAICVIVRLLQQTVFDLLLYLERFVRIAPFSKDLFSRHASTIRVQACCQADIAVVRVDGSTDDDSSLQSVDVSINLMW